VEAERMEWGPVSLRHQKRGNWVETASPVVDKAVGTDIDVDFAVVGMDIAIGLAV